MTSRIIIGLFSFLTFSCGVMTKSNAKRHYSTILKMHDYCKANSISNYERGLNQDKYLEKGLKRIRAKHLTYQPMSATVNDKEPKDSVLTLISHGKFYLFGHYRKIIYDYSLVDKNYIDFKEHDIYSFSKIRPRLYFVKKAHADR